MAQSFQSFDGWFQPTEVDEHAPGAHLFVCQHGLWGSPADTSYLATYLRHQGYAVLNAAANTARCTFDGADVCGDRLAAEVVAALHQLAAAGTPATSLSFAAYSFGGLIARYAAGKLMAAGLLRAGSGSGSGSGGCIVEQQEQHPHQNGASTEAGAGAMWPTATPPGALVAAASGLRPLRAANFLTIASPHLGCWEEPASLTHQAYNSILPVTLSRTGRQLLLADHWLDPQAAAGARGSGGGSGGGGGLPLLAVMADPTCVFHAALALFDKRVLLADIRLDRTVPYCTAAISRHNPYSPQGADSSGSGISSTNARVSRSFQQSADPILGGKRAAAGRAGSSGVTCTAAARRQLPLVQEEEHVRGAAVVVGSLDGRGPAAKLMASAGIPGRAAGSTAVSDNCADDCAEADAEPADGPLAAAVSVTGGLLAGWVPPLLRCVPGWSLASGLTAALVELAAGVACPGSGSRWASGVLAGGLPGLGFLLGSSTSSRNGLAATSGNRPSCGEAKGRDTAQHVPTGAASCGCGACSDPHDALRPADCSCSADQVSRVRGAALVRSMSLAAQNHSAAGSSSGLHTGLRGSSGGGMLALPISSAYPCIVTPHAPPPARRQHLQPPHGPPVAPAASSGIGVKGPWGAGASSARASNGASSFHKTVLTAAAGAAAGDGTAGASGSGTCGSGSDGRPVEGGAALRRAHSSPSRSGWAAAAAGAGNAGNSSGGESSGGSDWGLSAAPPAYGSDGAVPAHRPSAAAYLDWHWQPSYAAARVGALGGSGFGSGVFRGGTGVDDALGGGGSGGGLLSASPRLRLGLFLALLPVLLALWGCMVAWLAGCWLHHVALLLAVRPDRGWDVRLPTSAASGLPVPPRTERWAKEQEQRPHTSQSDQQPTGPAYMGHQASSEDVAHQGVGGTAAAGGMDASRAQDLAGPAVVRAVVATAVGNVLRRHGEEPRGAPHGSGTASRSSAITAAACTTAVAAAVAAAHAPRDTAALLDNMITHLNMLKWQKVDVDTGHYAAHAAIVVRSSRRFGRSHGHIIEYALRQLRP